MKTVYAIKQISEHDVTNTEMHTTRISKVETRIVGVYNDKNNAMIDAVRFMNLTAESMKNSKHAKESIDYTKMTSAFSLLKNGETYCSTVFDPSELMESSEDACFTDDIMDLSKKLVYTLHRRMEIEETRLI